MSPASYGVILRGSYIVMDSNPASISFFSKATVTEFFTSQDNTNVPKPSLKTET